MPQVERSAIVSGDVEHGRCGARSAGRGGNRHLVSVAADEVSAFLTRRPLVDEDVPFPELGTKVSEGSLGCTLLGLLR